MTFFPLDVPRPHLATPSSGLALVGIHPMVRRNPAMPSRCLGSPALGLLGFLMGPPELKVGA